MVVMKVPAPVTAFCLGEGSALEASLLQSGQLRRLPNGRWEVFSQECTGSSGQLAQDGDYVKLDSQGFPYPNHREYFLASHRRQPSGQYVQLPTPLTAWQLGEPLGEEMQFLLEHRLLRLDHDDPEHFFAYTGWGTLLTAARDAVVLFRHVERGGDGGITDIDFSFVKREVFDATYRVLEQ